MREASSTRLPRPGKAGGANVLPKKLIGELSGLRAEMLRLEGDSAAWLGDLHEAHAESARNLLHYVALRRRDLRGLQQQLAEQGLSSLGRSESHVMHNVESVLGVLRRLAGSASRTNDAPRNGTGLAQGQQVLAEHARALLGPAPEHRGVRIMVTMPGDAADDYELVRDLLAGGMDCMRVNCAHDGEAAWARMIANLRRAERETGKSCRVLMDLPGPKLRTGLIGPGPAVVRGGPRRDALGRVTSPARVWLTADEGGAPPPEPAEAVLPVSRDWLAGLRTGDAVKLFDARGASRALKVKARAPGGVWAESNQTSYVTPGTLLTLVRERVGRVGGAGRVGELPPAEQLIRLRKGDTLVLTRDGRAGRPARHDRRGRVVTPASISITLPEAFACVREGERVWLDDGRIGGRIRSVNSDEIRVEITHARSGREKLGADKGVNLPDSRLRLPALTAQDLEVLPFVARHADLVGYSFVRSAADVRELQARLTQLGGASLGVVLKIETARAFERLPELLLAAMRSPAAGVMIARGDLAVECGYERLAEVQEEILWMCEAAHVPVVWATQVLESLAKDGLPSRAEITDAAMGERAECVMLNKGPYVLEAVRALDDILRRMQSHQSKKRPMLRPLKLADRFAAGEAPSGNRPDVNSGMRGAVARRPPAASSRRGSPGRSASPTARHTPKS